MPDCPQITEACGHNRHDRCHGRRAVTERCACPCHLRGVRPVHRPDEWDEAPADEMELVGTVGALRSQRQRPNGPGGTERRPD